MITNNEHKIKVRVLAPTKGLNYVDESVINWDVWRLHNADRRFYRKEFRIIKKIQQFDCHPEE